MDLQKISHALQVWNGRSTYDEMEQAQVALYKEDMVLEMENGVVYARYDPELAAEGLSYYSEDEE
jgi:hypothetical protein